MDLGAEQTLLHDILREAGDIALKHFRQSIAVTTKDDNTPVTEADFAVDRHLKKRLLEAFPDYGWVSEESQTEPDRETGRVWVVDPIDGTRAFVHDRDDWCVSVALVENGSPVLAGIYRACTDDMYEARITAGATLNNKPMKVTARRKPDGCRVVAYEDALRRPEWHEPWPEMSYQKLNSMALRLAVVASGDCDAVVTLSGKSDWDLAAGDLLVHEAGGKITDFSGQPFDYGGAFLRKPNIVAAGSLLHSDLLDRTKKWSQSDHS